MCTMITSAIQHTRDAVWDAAKTLQSSASKLGREFENLTEKALPPVAARIVQRVVYGLPFAALALTLPAYLQLAGLATYAIVHIAHDIANAKDAKPFSQATYQNLFTGLGVAYLYRAGNETVKLATQQKASPVAIAIHCLIASFFVSKAVASSSPVPEPTP